MPSGIYAWDIAAPSDIVPSSFDLLYREARTIDFFLIGTGENIVRLVEPLTWRFRDYGFQFDVMSTLAAARTYNVLIGEKRRVAAALIAMP